MGGPPLQHQHTVHTQGSLVHIHIGKLRVLGALGEQDKLVRQVYPSLWIKDNTLQMPKRDL